MEYFKEKLFPDLFKFFLNVLSGIVLLYAGLVLKKTFEKNDSSLFSLNLSPALSVLLYIVYFSILLFFIWKCIKGIRAIFFSYIDHFQNEYVPPNIDLSRLDDASRYNEYHYLRPYESFRFRIKEASMSGVLQNIFPEILLGISDPKCFDTDCVTDLIVKRSYFGFYKYSCPNCKKKYTNKYDQSTLKANLKKVILAEHERKEDELPF